MSSQPISLGTHIGKVIHLIDNQLTVKGNALPIVDKCIDTNEGSSKHIYRVGEHYLPEPVMRSYDVLILHPTQPNLWREYLTNILKNKVVTSVLHYFINHEDRILYVYNNVLNMLNRRTLYIPHKDKYISNLDVLQIQGLNLTSYYIDYDFDSTRDMTHGYLKTVSYMSRIMNIYEMYHDAWYDGSKFHGTAYCLTNGKLLEVTTLGEVSTRRNVPSRKMIYDKKQEVADA